MIPPLVRALCAAGALLGVTVGAAAAEPAIVTKARAYLGPEAVLNAVESVHFIGTLVTTSPADPTKQTRAAVEIFFQSPERQRIQATSDKTFEVTALNGYEAWQRVQDTTDPKKWREVLLGPAQIKRLRANTWESLGFYRGIEGHGGKIEDQGSITVDGVACEKLAFIYDPTIIFYRCLDRATGRLVYTETESGGTLREQGEIVSGGIRFPKTIVTTTKNADGQTQTVTLSFEKITVNESLPVSLFAVPAPSAK